MRRSLVLLLVLSDQEDKVYLARKFNNNRVPWTNFAPGDLFEFSPQGGRHLRAVLDKDDELLAVSDGLALVRSHPFPPTPCKLWVRALDQSRPAVCAMRNHLPPEILFLPARHEVVMLELRDHALLVWTINYETQQERLDRYPLQPLLGIKEEVRRSW